jgi:hypothetical protein
VPLGCRRRRRLGLACALAALAIFPGAILAAAPAGEPAPRATATARLTVVVPADDVRRAIARHCRERATTGYVPVVDVPAATPGVPPDGRFVRCPSGDTVFLVPDPG